MFGLVAGGSTAEFARRHLKSSSRSFRLVDEEGRLVGKPSWVRLSGGPSVLRISARWIVVTSIGLVIALGSLAAPAHAAEMIEGDGYSLKVPPGFKAFIQDDCDT